MNNVSLDGNAGNGTDDNVTILDRKVLTRTTRATGIGAMASKTVAHIRNSRGPTMKKQGDYNV